VYLSAPLLKTNSLVKHSQQLDSGIGVDPAVMSASN
jgi:hypothetical protein